MYSKRDNNYTGSENYSVDAQEWEEWYENGAVAYDPNEKIQNSVIYVKPKGRGKAAKRKSRMEHIANCQRLEEEMESSLLTKHGKYEVFNVRQPKSWGKAAAAFGNAYLIL